MNKSFIIKNFSKVVVEAIFVNVTKFSQNFRNSMVYGNYIQLSGITVYPVEDGLNVPCMSVECIVYVRKNFSVYVT